MSKQQFVRDLATNHSLWDEYIDPGDQGGDDFNTMTVPEKMAMIVDLWPQDVRPDDDEGLALIAMQKRAAGRAGRAGGKSTSAAKQAASRKNGKLGGRPRKHS